MVIDHEWEFRRLSDNNLMGGMDLIYRCSRCEAIVAVWVSSLEVVRTNRYGRPQRMIDEHRPPTPGCRLLLSECHPKPCPFRWRPARKRVRYA